MGLLSLFKKSKEVPVVNDWRPVWTTTGQWRVDEVLGSQVITSTTQECAYEIIYSPTRNEYRLLTHGYEPKYHPRYKAAVEALNLLIKQSNQHGDSSISDAP